MDNDNVIEGTVVPTSQMNLAGVMQIPAVRQVVLLIGVAAAIAAGFAIAFWSQSPSYTQLYGGMNGAESADVADALRAADIDFKVNSSNGSIMVAAASLHDARMELASQGLPKSSNIGMGMLDEKSSFGDSQFLELARYQHALETELARTISSLGVVRQARVHLGLPKQSTFIRDQKSASASVLLQLAGGGGLESDQASAIINLVASSVPNLQPRNVTLIDQYGRLLSSGDRSGVDAQATSEFEFARKLEETYRSRIEALLTPLVGAGRVRAQVVADVDFTVAEETRESFDPARTVVRSEQINEESRNGAGSIAAGIPGATSNQPPAAAASADAQAAARDVEKTGPENLSRSAIRNFEVDRTISHVRPSASTINRLSVAVLVDDSPLEGETDQAPLSDADVERYTALVREAVGFNAARGDTVVVVNAAFRNVAPAAEVEPPPFWEKPILRDVLKQVLGAALVLALMFGVIRPMLSGVMASHGAAAPQMVAGSAQLAAAGTAGLPQMAGGAAALPPPKYEEKVAAAKNITGHDPARVAQVVKQWVSAGE